MKFLCLDFINSRWYITHKPFSDPLDDCTWLAQFCNKWDLPELIPSMRGFEKLITFREFMFQTLMKMCVGRIVGSQEIHELNQILLQGTPKKVLVEQDGHYILKTQQQSDDIAWIMYQIVLSFSVLITEYPLQYLKKCGNPECDWIFYDDSKSHTRKWCDNRCASLMKVRRYRASKKRQEQ
ncbi:MAG: CGNR zinc finger domain-containing protein [Spirochaetia bacterium]|nr:CGNR zinc finger domain-containing protein [Spirochaetia bacterium]